MGSFGICLWFVGLWLGCPAASGAAPRGMEGLLQKLKHNREGTVRDAALVHNDASAVDAEEHPHDDEDDDAIEDSSPRSQVSMASSTGGALEWPERHSLVLHATTSRVAGRLEGRVGGPGAAVWDPAR